MMSADDKLLATVTIARISKCTKFLGMVVAGIGYLTKLPKMPIVGTVICFVSVIAEEISDYLMITKEWFKNESVESE